MEKMAELKILVCGDVNGDFKSLFSKVSNLVKKKGTFEYLFCVGNFFGGNNDQWEDVKSGRIEVPVTTYVLGPNEQCHEKYFISTDLAPNISWLGRKGYFRGSSGLKIAYLSGVERSENQAAPNYGKEESSNDSKFLFSKEDVKNMISSRESECVIDILLTSQWPKGAEKYAVPLGDNESLSLKSSSLLISYLAKALKPRIHFSGLAGIYYERIPYRNSTCESETGQHVTRFIGLAPVTLQLQKKYKWLYAFNMAPGCGLPAEQLKLSTGPVTSSPYDSIASLDSEDSQQFFYATASAESSKRNETTSDRQNKPSKKLCTIDSSKCWFCLSNLDVEKKLVITIGNHCYLTLAKGILVPDHVLIVPIKHAVSSVELPCFVSEEIEKIKNSLLCYFSDQEKDAIFFERNYLSAHLQLQAVPVPKNLKSAFKQGLLSTATQYNLEFSELPNYAQIQQIVPPKKSYFYIELVVNKKSEAKYLHVINGKFPLQFGRIVLASPKILNVAHRVDWRKCEDTTEERRMAEKLRKSFAHFDFTV